MRLMVENLEGRDLMTAGVTAGLGLLPGNSFTPPIDSNKGSVIEANVRVVDITDGTSNTLVIGAADTRSATGKAEGWVGVGAETQADGIIAILIGLQAPPQLTPTIGTANEVLVSCFQGGCSKQDTDEAAVHQAIYILPYIEQENLFKAAS